MGRMRSGITGIGAERRKLKKAYKKTRDKTQRMAHRVSADLARKAAANAPIRRGDLRASISERVVDRGFGRGFRIITSTGDKPYEIRMHEGHYQARARSEVVRRTSKKTGKVYWTLRKKPTRQVNRQTENQFGRGHLGSARKKGGFLIGPRGQKIGRRYLTRAADENMPRYQKMFRSLGERTIIWKV